MISFALTDVGVKRTMNQDAVFISDTKIGDLPNLYVVADGMGGENAGDYASKRCIEVLTEEVARLHSSTPVEILQQAIQAANNKIFDEAAKDLRKKGMGTTLVAATVIGKKLIVANVGDSRLYVANSSEFKQITKDHSVVAELVRNGELEESAARTDERKNMITRAVGAEANVTADYFEVKLTSKAKVLLCSDGLTNMVEDKEIYSVLMSSDSIENKATRLVELANEYGGKDNVSTVVIEAF